MQKIKAQECKGFDCTLDKNENNYTVTLYIKDIYPRYTYKWIKRGVVTLENVNLNTTFFPTTPTNCLDIDRDSKSKIVYTLLECDGNPSAPLRKIVMTYQDKETPINKLSDPSIVENEKEQDLSKKEVEYFCVILGGVVSFVTIVNYFRKKKSA